MGSILSKAVVPIPRGLGLALIQSCCLNREEAEWCIVIPEGGKRLGVGVARLGANKFAASKNFAISSQVAGYQIEFLTYLGMLGTKVRMERCICSTETSCQLTMAERLQTSPL